MRVNTFACNNANLYLTVRQNYIYFDMSSKILYDIPNNESSAIVHHLVSLFITYCKSRDERLSRKTAELIVGIILLNPYWREKLQREASKTEIQAFMRDCFNYLYDERNISSTTVKMQCLFYGKYLTREQFKEHKKDVIMKNCNHLLQKLKKVWHNPTEDFSEMHDDLVKFILIKEGMDDKDDLSAFDEIKTAVNSVLPASELSTFVINNQKIKTAFINEVSSIASGIRLHAWYSNKAGKFMFDVGKLMKETLPRVSDEIHEEIITVKELLDELQTYLRDKIAKSGDSEELLHKKQLLINTTNYYSFIKKLKENIDEIASETYRLDYKFTICIKELNSVLKTGPFCKADKAYPFYKEIGQTWKSLQSEGYLLDFYSNLFSELKEMHENVAKMPETEENNSLISNELEIEMTDDKPIVVEPDSVKNFSYVTLDIEGFCAYYCSMGILVPAVKEIGILMYKNSCYGFSSNKALNYFQKQPNVCIAKAKRFMQVMPELIISVCKEEYFGLPIINTSKHEEVLPVFVSDRSVQTVLHCSEQNIDYSYNWNQWNMRKEAIKYVDLLTKKTHSTQTDLSHFRRENFSQVYLPKDNWTQTRRDTGTTMSRTGVPELYR